MRVSNSLWTVSVLLSGVSQSSQKAIPDAALAARQDGIPPLQTVTIPGTVSTITGATLTQVATETVPARTTTVTEDGHLVISTYPAQNTVKTKVLEISPYPVSLPGSVTVVTPISQITLCPEPTGRVGANLRTDESLIFGCSAGFVCNPPMPDTCNFWPGEPSPDFACRPEDCIPAPPTRNEVIWDGKKIAYYSPAWGYFHLDPRPFGLSYDIYEYGSSSNAKRNTINRKLLGKRQSEEEDTPQPCISDCDNALTRGQSVGQPGLCDDTQFRINLRVCEECVIAYALSQNVTNPVFRDYVGDSLETWRNQCDGEDAETTTSPGPPGQGPSTTSGTGITVTGQPTSSRSFETFTNTPSSTSSATTSSTTSETTISSSSSSFSSATTSSSTTSDTTSTTSITSVTTTEVPSSPGTTLSTPSSISSDATSSGTFSSSSSASVETSSSGSPGSLSTGSPEPSSTGSPESPSTSSPDVPSTGSPEVPSASSAETPGFSETSGSTAPPSTPGTATSTSGTASSPGFPTPSGTSVSVEPSGSSPGFAGPGTTPSTVVTPTEPTDAPGGTPVAPPSSAVARLPAGITLVAMLLAALALLL